MTTDAGTIAAGRETWARRKGRERKDWQDWLCVGRVRRFSIRIAPS